MSNACSGEPGEVPDEEVNAHLGNPGLETSRRVTMRAWMCLLEMGLLMAGCTDNPSTQPGGRDGGIDGDRGARPVAYGNRQVDVSHRVYRGEYLVRSFLVLV